MEEENIIVATAANYWVSPNALVISLNALGEPNRIQCSVAGGAEIMAYVRGVKPVDHEHPEYNDNGDGLEYDVAHNYRHWPLAISPTWFNTNDRKYLYVRVPKTADAGATAQVVFPSEILDIYGYPVEEAVTTVDVVNADGTTSQETTTAWRRTSEEPLGSQEYFYIWLQGIISSSGEEGDVPRVWEQQPDTGYLNSDEAYSTTETEWYRWEPISGTVTFLKNIWMSAESWFQNLQAIDGIFKGTLKVQGLLDAVRAKIDSIESHNFISGLLDGAGFRLTADNGDGNSELEVDFLKVRKKATFMELEIRKETYTAGNQNYSPAGSIIYRVDYMDEHDEALGYSVMKVPFLLKKFAFLGRMFNYAARKRVRRAMTPEEWRQVHHFRCYLLADDGTTATRNWWRVGDQPRCQAFNKAASAQAKQTWNAGGTQMDDPSEPMAERNYTSQPIETAYYWRLVSNTGAERLDDGHVYDFIDMPYEGWSGYSEHDRDSFRDPGSGIPVAGDAIVCVGSRVEEDRMNMVSIQTTGAENDPPAIKGYRGIHTFSLASEENRVFVISPKEFLVKSQVFRLLDDSGYEFRLPLERGEWQKGLRYHYYDRVSWLGSIWLCIVSDIYVWEDAAGNKYSGDPAYITDIEVGEGQFEYTAVIDGETYRGYDHYYKTGQYNGTTYYYIRNYTYSEPSRANNLWVREVSKGTEISDTVVHYAASLSGTDHPNDDSDEWKDDIESTGILQGQYLWTRTTVYYDDPNDPDREPTRTYSVARWGIDGDGISEVDAYYSAMDPDTYQAMLDDTDVKGDMAKYEQKHASPDDPLHVYWYDTFEMAVAATQHTIGEIQGWYIWEKTQIVYDMAPNPDGTPRPKPDLVNYRVTRIAQDGQIGQEEYYCLREYDTYDKAFPKSFDWAAPFDVGIQWNNQRDPAADDWRLINTDDWSRKICTEQTKAYDPWKQTTQHPNCPVWSPVMPAYDDSTPAAAKKKYLWNFEQRVDGMGTQYATQPICIGDHSRGIMGVLELYALSASGQAQSGHHIPDDIWAANGNSETDYSHSSPTNKLTWTDEIYDRAPQDKPATLPYQWNWTRTLYNQPKYPGGIMPDGTAEPTDPTTGYWFEDHYHVSAVRGTRGEDGAGVEYIYCRTKDATPPQGYDGRAGNVPTYGHIDADETETIGGQTYPRCRCEDDFVPDAKTVGSVTYTWTDNPVGITQEWPYEWVSERKSAAYLLSGQFSGGHIWGEFSAPAQHSKWGYNGEDGDGVEYVFMRTRNDVAPAFNQNDVISGYTSDYESDEWRPYINNKDAAGAESNRCTDDPKGTTREWPFEWVAKRNKAAAATSGATQGQRKWKSYYECTGDNSHKMSKWSTYSTLRLDIDNEMDMVPTESGGYIRAAHTVETVVRLYDGATEIDLSSATIGSGGIVLSGEPASTIATRTAGTSGKGRKLSWAFKAGQTMADSYEISISYTYNNVTYHAVFTIAASKGQRIYQLSPSHSSLICPRNSSNTLDNPPALSLAVNRIDGGSSTVIASPTTAGTYKDGDVTLTVRYSTSAMPATSSDGTAWPKANSLQVDAGGTVTSVFFALFNSSGTLLDRETVPVIRDGKNGQNVVRLDLDNENDSMLYDGAGNKLSGNVTSKAYMFDGASDVSGNTTFTISAREGVTAAQAAISGRVVTVTGMNADTARVTVQGVYTDGTGQTHTETAVLTLKKLVGTDKYDLDIRPNALFLNTDDGWGSSKTIVVKVMRTAANGGTPTSVDPSDYGLAVSASVGTLSSYVSTVGGLVLTVTQAQAEANSDTVVTLYKSGDATKVYDRETIPFNKAEDGDNAVTYAIDCDDIIKPGDTALNVWVIRTDGDSSVRKTLAAAYTDWELTLEVSKSNITKAELNTQYYLIVLSGVTASSKVTLTLKKGSDVKDTVVVHGVADGDAGHVGRWYYYAGEWDANTDYLFEKTRAPFVLYDNNYYMLDCGSSDEPWKSRQQSDSTYTSRNETPAGNGKPWSQMQSTFKYIITEAIFTDYAHLSAFVFNGDWMISTNGTIQGIAYNSSDWKNPAKYNGKPAYEWFDPSNPNSGNGFIPNFAIDGLTGKTYQNDAYVKGQIVATSGKISGTMTLGTYGAGNKSIRLNPSDTNGAGISGYNGTSMMFRLGFNTNSKGYLSMGSGYFQEDAVLLTGSKGAAALIASDTDTGSSYLSISKIIGGATKSANIAINLDGRFVISSANWPTNSSQVPVGGVYIDPISGVMFVKI